MTVESERMLEKVGTDVGRKEAVSSEASGKKAVMLDYGIRMERITL